MKYFAIPIAFLIGTFLGGGLVRFLRAPGEGASTRWQKTRLVVVTALISAFLLLGTGYGYLRYRFRPRIMPPATARDALADFRAAGQGGQVGSGMPRSGVYTYNTKGFVKVQSSLLGDTDRRLPASLPALLTVKGECWELNIRRTKGNESTERYCRDRQGVRLVERRSRGAMFGFTSTSRVVMGAHPIIGPTGLPGSTWTEQVKVVEHTTTSPFKRKRPDSELKLTYVGPERLKIGEREVAALHVRQEAVMKQDMRGTMERHIWYAADTGMVLKTTLKSQGEGLVKVEADEQFTLASTTPQR